MRPAAAWPRRGLAALGVAALTLPAPAAPGSDTPSGPRAALEEAISADDPAAVESALAAGADPAAGLVAAARRGRTRAVEKLLAMGARADSLHGDRARLAAYLGRHPALAERLRRAGADFSHADADGHTALHLAATRRRARELRVLLRHHDQLDATNRFDATALMIAAELGLARNVGLLLAAGASPETADRDGWTALHFAARAGRGEVAARLLARGAEADRPSALGWTPLALAAAEGHAGVVAELLAAGVAVDRVTAAAGTALGRAVTGGHHEVVRLLAAAGAAPGGTGVPGSPRWWAARSGDATLVALLAPAEPPA